MGKPLETLHKALLDNNYDVPEDYASFEETLTAKGEEGYRNRHTLWKSLYDTGYDVPDNYDDFRNTLFAAAPQPQTQPPKAPQVDIKSNQYGRQAWTEEQPKDEQKEESVVEKTQRMLRGEATPEEQQAAQKNIQQRKDEIEYEQATGKRLRQPGFNPEFEAPVVARDEEGNMVYGENGEPVTGFTTDKNIVSAHHQIEQEQEEWDALSDDEKRERAEQDRLRLERDEYKEPTLFETIGKKLGSGFMKLGLGMLEAMQQLSSGLIVEDASSPTGYSKTKDYDDTLNDKDNHIRRSMELAQHTAERMSREGEPEQGEGFLDLLWDGKIGTFLQKGVGTAMESLPMTLSIYSPYTMLLNAISMAGNNYRDQTLDNPNVAPWKRAAMSVGSAAIEQAVEMFSDPIFKYVGGRKLFGRAAKKQAEELTKEMTQRATQTLAQRIYHALGHLAKDAAGEGAEEVITNFGNDALGEALDLLNGDKDFGLRAQWEKIKKENPNADLWDFAVVKAKENIESFIGGAMAGMYMSGTTQASVNALQYALGGQASAEAIASNPDARIDPVTMEVADSYDDGYSETDPNVMKQFSDEAQAAEQILPQYGQEFAKMVMESQSPVETMDYLMENRGYYTDEQIAAAGDYFSKKAAVDGMMDGAANRIDEEVEAANAEVRANTHQETGQVIRATIGDEDYYVLGGEVVTENGLTSVAGTGGAVVVKNVETGEVSVQSVASIIPYQIDNAEDLIQQNETMLRPQLEQQVDDDITFGGPAQEVFQQEDTIALNDGQGGVVEGVIGMLPNAVDGVYVIYTNDGQALQMTDDELQRRIVVHNGVEVKAAPVEQNGGQIAQEGAPIAQNPTQNAQGAQAAGEAGSVQTGGNEPAASAISKIPVRMGDDGKPVTNRKGKPVLDWHKASVEDAAAALVETTGGDMLMARDTASDLARQAESTLEKIRKQKPKGEDPIEMAESRVAIRRQEQEQQAIIKQWKDVNHLIQQQMQQAQQKAIAEREAAKSEEQRQREAEEAKAIKERQDAEQAERRRKQIEEEVAQWNKPYAPLTKAKREMAGDADALEILNNVEPRSLEEWVSSLIRPQSMMWEDETDEASGRTIIGLQSELGLQKKDVERIGGLVATRKKGGKPFGQVVHDIWEDLPDGMKNMYDDQDVRNTLIGLFNEGNTMRMRHLTEEHRIEEARAMMQENERRDAEAELEAWAEAYHLTPEERETFEDYMQQAPTAIEQEIINNILADESYRRSRELDQQSVSGTNVPGATESQEEVRQASQAVSTGDNEEAATQGRQRATGEQTSVADNVPGRTQSLEREYIKEMLHQIGEDVSVANAMSDYEVEQLNAMLEDWDAHNDDYGMVIEQQKDALKSKDKKVRDAAQKKIDEAQAVANQAFEPVAMYIEELKAKYANVEEEGVIPRPKIDNPRFKAIRQNLVDALSLFLDTNTNATDVWAAAKAIRDYVDEGLDIDLDTNDDENLADWAFDYDGNDPEKLADQYIGRVYFDRYLDDDEDQEYIRSGILASMRNDNKFINGFEANENGVCINPHTIGEHKEKNNINVGFTIETAETDKGWVGGISCGHSTGGWGNPVCAGINERYFETEKECQAYWAQQIIDYFAHDGKKDSKVKKYIPSLQNIVNKGKKAKKPEITNDVNKTPSDAEKDVTLQQAISEVGNEIDARPVKAISSEADLQEYVNAGVAQNILNPIREDLNDPSVMGRYESDLMGVILLFAEKIKAAGLTKEQIKGICYHENVHSLADRGFTPADFEEAATLIDRVQPDLVKWAREKGAEDNLSDEAVNEEIVSYFVQFVDDKIAFLKGDLDFGDKDLNRKMDEVAALLTNNKYGTGQKNEEVPPSTPGGIRESVSVDEAAKEVSEQESERGTVDQQPIGKTSSPEEIAQEEARVDANPTEAQKEAGNYQKGHINVDGYDITIENPKGSIRRGTDADGREWQQEMHNTYGYIKGTEGVDGDHIDVFLSDNPASGKVWVIDQVNPKTGEFDEHKVMYGFVDAMQATQAYLSNYEDGWKGLGSISGISREEFKKWVESSHRKTKPFRDYVLAKSAEAKEKKEKKTAQPKEHKRIVSDDQMEELRKKLLEKFNNTNAGIDVERMLLGAMYAVGKIERGVTKFADYAAQMVDEIGDAIRPYLKAFYEAVRNMPEAAEYRDLMDTPEYVAAFDEYNFDKAVKTPNAITKAEQVVKKTKAKQQVKKIEKEVNQKLQQGDLFAGMFDETPAETGKKPVESGNKPAETGNKPAETVKPKQPVLRKAVPEDFDNDNPVVYYQGRPWSIIALTRKGEQVSATQFSKPTIESVVLTNGKSVPFSELMVEDKNAGKPQRKTAWWQDPNRPANLDPSDYKTYTTDEAKTYFASFVGPNNEKGKPFPDFTKWAHPNLAYITAAAWDGAVIPKEELMQIPEIAEAEENINNVESKGSLTISEDEMRQHAQHLLDAEHGSQVYKDGKKVKKDFSGPVKQEHTALIIIGKPAGGKSSVFAEQLSHDFGARIIDSDTVKPWLEGFDGGNGAGYVHDASAKVADMALDMAVEAGDNIIIPRIGGESVVKKLAVPRLIEKGYTVQLYFNDVLESTSIMRAASRFAEEGRYLSLVYLTRINDKDYKTFCNFAEKKIGDFYDERDNAERPSESPVLDMVLLGGERSKQGGNTSSGERTSQSVSPVVHDSGSLGGLRGTGKEVAEGERIFSYAEWKSNDVAFGEKPKEIWNSESGTPLSDVIKKQNNENQRTLSAKSSPVSEGTGQASGTADRAGEGRGTEPNRVERPGSASTVTTPAPAKPKQELHKNKRNNQGERGKDYAPTSVKARFNANVEAIKMMRALMDDGIEAPTKDQMEVLRQYSGWGGMGTYFNDESTAENKILRDLLDDEEYNDAVMSINSAYYTPATVIDTLWDIAKAMGFKGGNVLEGSAGIGNIIGQMPRDISRRSDIEAVEIDAISGNILKLLYPDAKVHIQGFQDTVIRNGSVDLAVTNVPFVTGLHVFDKVDKDLSRKFTNIHDFCIAKNIRKLREGGIGLFITSSGTLDKSTKLREWITDEGQADVVGAFRLNNETFGGTSVTSDIIVVRKRVNGQRSSSAIDVSKATPLRIGNYEDKYRNEHQVSMVVNDYFKEHPEMMAGEMFFGYEKGDTFRPGSYGLYPVEGKSQEKMMADFVKSMEKTAETVAAPVEKAVAVPNQLTAVKEGRMLVDDNGRLCISRYGEAVPLGVNDNKVKGQTKQQCFKDYQSVQAAVDEVLQQQLNDPDDAALQPKLDALNKAYDQFVKRYGIPYKNTAISFLRNDIDFPSFMALANYSETKDMKGKVTVTSKKSPLFSRRVLGFKTEPKPQTVKDAVIASIFRTNGIDLEWIAAKLSEVAAPPNGDHWTADDVRKGVLVSRLGFENPSTGQLEVRHQYLSGNVREKLAIAESYNTDGRYNTNVEELRKVVPMDIPAHLIDFSLGSSWIPNELYIDFIKESLGLDNVTLNHLQGRWSMVVNEWTAKRSESNKAKGVYSEKFHTHILGSDLLLSALNNRPYKVARQETEGYGSNKTTHTVVDQEATSACNVRIDEIKDEFKQYIRKRVQDDTELARRIEKIYNDKFNALVPMRVDDEMLPEKFDGANTIISLYDHQKRGVMRGVTSPTMLAHEVGTGKSFTLITTAMEMRRLGTAKKPMIVVQNATVAQMTADAKLLYPNARVLSLSEQDRDAEGRRAFYAKIKFNDWDMIIIPQSTLDRIPDSPERELQFIQEQIDEKKHLIEMAKQAKVDRKELERLERDLMKKQQEYGDKYLDSDPSNGGKRKKDAKREAAQIDKAETKAQEKLDRATDDVQFFDDLGVDALLVDEAHGYKHLGFETSLGRSVKGVDPSFSKKCAGLYNKTRAVFEKAGWKNVVFATGTPISNTAAEIWTFMKYLMPADVMKENDIYYFDDFVHNFGSINQMLEFKTNGKFNEVTRFAAYVNRPELMRIWMQVADIVRTEEVGEVKAKVPEKEKGKDQDVFLPQSPSLVNIMTAVRAELERFENMTGKEKRENSSIPLTMYGIAKRAAIDPRLVNPDAADEPLSKTNAAVKEILADLKSTKKYNGTVAVFCDNQNRLGNGGVVEFNIFDDMKAKLVAEGVPEKQIAIIKSSMSISAKQKIFDAVNKGEVRVIMGSTQTLGTGVNIQERLHCLIHMDAPDRPMDYTQRNGRIERQGNLHKDWGLPIRILRFGVEDSLDVTAYQRLKTKSGFIDSIMKGKEALANNQTDRTIEEEEEGLFDNPVAVLSGSQFAMKKNQAERELRKLQGKYNAWEADQIYVSAQLRANEGWVRDREKKIAETQEQLDFIRGMFPDGKVKVITVGNTKVDMTKEDAGKKLDEVIKEKINDPVNATVKNLRENEIYNDETIPYTIELDGHPVKLEADIFRTSDWDRGQMRTTIHKRLHFSSGDLRLDDGTGGIGTTRSVREILDDIMQTVISGKGYEDVISNAKLSIQRANESTEQLKQREGQPFQYIKEMAEAKERVEEYTALMKKELEEKEAKYKAQQQDTKDGFDLKKAADTEDDEVRYSADEDWDDAIFYSNAMRAVENIRQEKATPQQWLAMIDKNGGLKAGEDKWLGLSDWLKSQDKKSLTKQEVINYILLHEIEVLDVHYGRSPLDLLNEEFYSLRKKYMDAGDGTYLAERKAMNDLDDRYPGFGKGTYLQHFDDGTVYVDYDYDEPKAVKQLEEYFASNVKVIEDTRLQYTTTGLENKQEIALIVPTIEPYNQNDEIHFGDAGNGRAVAWVRFGETTIKPDGTTGYKTHDSFVLAMQKKYNGAMGYALREKMTDEEKLIEDKLMRYAFIEDEGEQRVLVIDEIQSKRHQDGREMGYGVPVFTKATIGEYKPTDEETEFEADIIAPNGNKIGTMIRYEYEDEPVSYSAMNNNGTHMTSARPTEQEALTAMDHLSPKGVPEAPFEKNWHELAMKRMLRYAAENGYDKIAWTTGAQQAERYNIGQVVKRIQSGIYPDGTRNTIINLNSGKYISLYHDENGNITRIAGDRGFVDDAKNLSDVVGKELAIKILSQTKRGKEGAVEYSGDNLRFGGEGMKGFYDQMLPRFMEKYGRKWGAKVSKIELPNVEAPAMWSVDITPEMKESVMHGQPLFRDMEQFADGDTFPIHVSHSYSDTDVVRRTSSYSTDLMPDEYGSLPELLDAIRRQYPAYYATIEDGNVRLEKWSNVLQSERTASNMKDAGAKSYIDRKTKRSIDAVNSLADMLHLNVEVLTSTDGLQGKKARSRGWFDPKTGKIVLVLPNHRNQEDLINTLLHEGVAHAGLRKMFGVHFDTFLDNVYNNVSPVIKARIDAAMKRNKWGRHEATEEYLAKLAERTDFDNAYSQGWWNKIKQFFLDMLTKVGVRMQELSDNELRYILWRSYDNLLHPNKRRNIFDKAREVQMQSRLRVGPYRERERIQWTGKVDASRIAAEAEPNNEEMLNKDFDSMTSQEILLSLSQKDDYGRNEAINELVRRIRTGAARIVRMGKDLGSERENDASLAGRIIGGWQLGLSSQSDETLGSVVSGIPPLEGRPTPAGQNTPTDYQHAIIEWAKATGHYISEEEVRESSPDKDVWHSGAQSRVYRTPDGKKVVKFMESWVYWQNPLLKNLDSIALHNAAGFVPMTVIGYSTDKNGKLRIVLEQDYVDGITVDDMFDDEPLIKINNYIDVFMEEELGLVRHIDPDGNLFHMKDGVIYKDFHGANIVVDKDFHRHVIDCYVSLADDDKKERTGSFVIEDNEKELFSIRTKEAPKKTGTGYKVFVLKDGELYPPMVANPGGEGTPVGVWLDADAAPVIGESKTGRPQVKAGGKGTQGGSGQLAYRPGWHLGTIPYALQFGRKDANGNKTLFPNNFVWAEVEYADDVDYQQEAHDAGINANGKYQHALAGLKHVPEDGSYKYRTNPNPNTDEWIITGAMRVKRILTRAEVDELVRKAGREPQQIQDGDIVTDDVVKQLNEEIQAMKEADDMGLLYSADEDWIDIAKGVYERAVAKESLKYQEAWQDSMVSLKAIQDAIAKQTGKVATGAEDAYHFENRMHGRAKNMAEKYIWNFYRPMLKAFHDFCKGKAYTMEQGLDYLVAKSGLERNVYFAFRTAAKDKLEAIVEAERKQIKQDYAHNRIDEKEYKKQMEALAKKEREGIDDVMDEVRNTLAWSRAKEDYANGTIDYTECLRRMEALIRSRLNTYNKYAHDYSGLTETFAKDWYDMAQDVKREAQAAVDPKERAARYHEYNDLMNKAYEMARQYAEDAVFSAEQDNKESVNGLWDAVNESTKETLKFSYESGLMSRSVYDRVRTMFDYYIPLRGWDEDKASDVYEYMGKDNVFSPAVKKAWGRTSKAENPLAYIGNIAVSTILSGHRNQLKQHFLNYVMNNPTNLVSISQSWYENIGTEDSPMWILRTADTAGKDADEIAQIVNDFNEEMQQKQREGLAMPVTGRLRLDVHATKGQKAEHVIEVQRGGHTYELYINGNPKAAQALNGSTARAVSRISDTFIGRQLTKLNRNMAMFFTSKNPAFVISNLSRDMNMAGASVAVNEGPEYNARFMANVAKVLTPRVATGDVASMGLKGLVGKGRGITGLMPKLMKKWQDGKLDDRNETERLFKEFMNEGGETGFVNMLSIDSFKEKMLDEISQMNGSTLFGSKAKVKEASISKALRLIGDTFEFYNRCAEDATRFAVYMTSRQMGKTLEQAIADAKDVTLNFNRKGTGDKGNAEIRDLFIFVNPAIQALANMYQMGKQHPLKLGAVTLGFVTVGALIPVLNAWMQNMWGDDDDKDSYWNLPPWVRKNNLVFWVPGTKNYITIPLAQEFRVFYGVGEMVSSVCYDHPNSNMGMEIVESFADLVPINPTGNGGNLLIDFTPTGAQPLAQLSFNTDFTGKPIWRENQGNKYEPMYTKAYISTPKWMTKISEGINYATGGDQDSRGWLERSKAGAYINNPAVWNHLLQGYFGGMYNTISKSFDVVTTAAQGEIPKVYQTPVVNRFVNRPIEREDAGVLGEDYWKLVDETEETMHNIRKKRQRAAEGDEDAKEALDELMESTDAKRAEVVHHYKGIIDALRKGEKSATDKETKKQIKLSITEWKTQMLEEVNAIDAGVDPLEAAMQQWDKSMNIAERKKLQRRIERLTNKGGGKVNTRDKDVQKAMQYVDNQGESAGSGRYLELATAEDIKNDARIKKVKSQLAVYSNHYKELMKQGKNEEAAEYYKANSKQILAYSTLDRLSRAVSTNKKLLGKGSDAAIMKIIGNSRNAMLKTIEGL